MSGVVQAKTPEVARAEGHKKPSLGRSFLWSAAEQGGMAVVSFVMLIVFARWLGPADFGLFAIVLAVVEVLAVLATTLFADALVQVRQLTRQHIDSAFTVVLSIGTLLVLGVALAMPWFTSVTGHPQAGVMLLAVAMSIPLAGVASVLTALKRRDMAFQQLAARSIAGRLSGAAVGVVAVVTGFGVWGLAVQHLVSAAMVLLLTWWLCCPGPRLAVHRESTVELLRLGGPVLGQTLLGFLGTRLFIVVFGILLGPEAAGHLTLAFRLVNTGWALVASAVNQVLLPALVKLTDEGERMRQRWLDISRATGFIVFPAFAVLAVIAVDLLPALFGNGWGPAAPVVAAMGAAVIISVPTVFAMNWFKAVGRGRPLMWWSAIDLLALAVLIGAAGLMPATDVSLRVAAGVWLVRSLVSASVALWLVLRHAGPGAGSLLLALMWPTALALGCAALAWSAAHALPNSMSPLASTAAGLGAAVALWLPATWWALRRWRLAPPQVIALVPAGTATTSAL